MLPTRSGKGGLSGDIEDEAIYGCRVLGGVKEGEVGSGWWAMGGEGGKLKTRGIMPMEVRIEEGSPICRIDRACAPDPKDLCHASMTRS